MHYCTQSFSPLLGALDTDLPCIIQIEHCLHEWESGIHVPTNLDETVDGPRYRNHMSNAVAWKNLNDNATTRVLEHISSKLSWVPNDSYLAVLLTLS